MKKKRFLKEYSVFDIIIISMFASLGIAIKPIIVPLAHIITGPLFIPGGAVAGGFYMLFIVIVAGLVRKNFSATLACTVQALLVIVTGVIGSHGVMSLITYILPGLVIDLFLFLFHKKRYSVLILFVAGMIANLTGSFLSNLVFFRLPVIPLMVSLFASALSGGLGGVIAFIVVGNLKKYNPAFRNVNEDYTNNKKGRVIYVIFAAFVLVSGLFVFSYYNRSNVNVEKSEYTVIIEYEEKNIEIDLDYIKSLESVGFYVNNLKDNIEYKGITLLSVFEDKGIDVSSTSEIIFIASDGYTSAATGDEVNDLDNIYLVYERNSEPSGLKEDGGSGPIEIVIKKDEFSNRWCKFLSKIVIK